MARGLPFTYGPSRTALESSTARAMGVYILLFVNDELFGLFLNSKILIPF